MSRATSKGNEAKCPLFSLKQYVLEIYIFVYANRLLTILFYILTLRAGIIPQKHLFDASNVFLWLIWYIGVERLSMAPASIGSV